MRRVAAAGGAGDQVELEVGAGEAGLLGRVSAGRRRIASSRAESSAKEKGLTT